jgi:hypothetical protein
MITIVLRQCLLLFWFVPLRAIMFLVWVIGYGAVALLGVSQVKDFTKPLTHTQRWFVNGTRAALYFINNTMFYMWHLGFYYVRITGDPSV